MLKFSSSLLLFFYRERESELASESLS